MTTTKTQTRGNCQCCGRIQAVVSSTMSKHGYTVDHGWFNGVCSGQKFPPLQTSRDQADKIISQVLADCVALDKRIADLDAGLAFPSTVRGSYNAAKNAYDTIPFADASAYKQAEAVKSAIWNTKQRAKMGRDFAADLEALADRLHGTALVVVKLEDGPARIEAGEKRLSGAVVLTATGTDKGRVYWKGVRAESGKTFSSWTGATAWRKLPMA